MPHSVQGDRRPFPAPGRFLPGSRRHPGLRFAARGCSGHGAGRGCAGCRCAGADHLRKLCPRPGPDSSPAALAARNAQRHQSQRRARSAARAQADTEQLIVRAVRTELDKAEGDADAATAALIKRAIPDVMALFDETRVNARYDYTAYPALPDILHKPKKGDPDLIWEARPNWRHPDHRRHPDGPLHVTALDVNAAYLSAMKTWLPIGKLEHSTDGTHDRKRAGVHLITPPPWDHRDLPNPSATATNRAPCG
ncbi:hypothetical protein [Streptomyces rimosus]|uniref:hypothetical protein n=1 Tax=Streptomyces rimosus TaxID=1927 RepID=UPI00210057B3